MAKSLGILPIVETETTNTGIILTFLDESKGELAQVKLNFQKYDPNSNTFVDDLEQEEKFNENLEKFLGISNVADVPSLVGKSFEVFGGEKFNALWEIKEFSKFSSDDIGQLINATISGFTDYETKTSIELSYEDKIYSSNINYGNYIESLGKAFVNPQKKIKQLENFEKKFHVPFDEKESLIGTQVMIEVKKNQMVKDGTFIEIKALPKK